MPGTRARGAVIGALLMLALALPGVVGAGTRIPVGSVDDAGQPRANRTAAVTNIVVATNARLGRVINAFPPNPCAVTEPTAQCDAAIATVSAYGGLASDVLAICEARPIDGSGASVIDDADLYAADTSPTGIANQLASVATVLVNADRRLGSIYVPPSPIVPPNDLEAAALLALLAELATGDRMASAWLGVPPNPIFPPNPVCPAAGVGF